MTTPNAYERRIIREGVTCPDCAAPTWRGRVAGGAA